MKIAVLGAGPAGSYAAYLLKKGRPDLDITVFERNPRDATWGFGVVFSERALSFLEADDPETYGRLVAAMESWPDQRIVHRDAVVSIDGNGFSAIGRLRLLQLLCEMAEGVGVTFRHETDVTDPAALDDADLVIGADGVNSLLREREGHQFRPTQRFLTNRFVWYGTTQPFEALTLTFRANADGHFVAHHYRYTPEMSTFIVEVDAATFERVGFARMSDAESRSYCEAVFAKDLGGHPLISNKSIWRRFPVIANREWTHRNRVLIGDALRSAHFSIGSGTRLAMEDSIALARAVLDKGDDVEAGLAAFVADRRPIVEKITRAAAASFDWYEDFAEHMRLSPHELAHSYMTRSGRVDDDRLTAMAPRFMAEVREQRARVTLPPDPVPEDTPESAAIGFRNPGRINASALLFDNLEQGRGERTALICQDRAISYAALADRACRAGNALAAFGLERGDRVLLLMDDTPDYVAVIMGAMRAGFVPILANTLAPADLMGYLADDSGARVVVTEPHLWPALRQSLAEGAGTALRAVLLRGEAIDPLPRLSLVPLHEALACSDDRLEPADTSAEEMAFWMYSSGSTGRPKGVVHLHHDPLYSDLAYGRPFLNLGPDDICFSPPKIFFAYGFGNSVTFPMRAGAATLLHPGRADPGSVFDLIERNRPTVLFGLPTLYTALLNQPGAEARDLSSLRLCVSAAETLTPDMHADWKRRYGLSIMEGLGSTEVLHIYLSNLPDLQKPGSCGKAVPGYTIRLVDPDGAPVPRGQDGIMMVRGDSQAPCYWNRPDKTAETMRDGWIWTGDRFVEDEDGFYAFQGRADDLVKVSGQWVHPLEIERCLADHPNVRACAVLAVTDQRGLMTTQAFVALKDATGSEALTRELQDYVKGRLLPYKYPRVVTYLDDLPTTGTGKIDRQALKSKALA